MSCSVVFAVAGLSVFAATQRVPHIAAQASDDVVAQQTLQALLSARQGQRPLRAVNREAGY